jgi:hypothetical protein
MIIADDELERRKLPQPAQRRYQRRRGVYLYNQDGLAATAEVFLFESAVTY